MPDEMLKQPEILSRIQSPHLNSVAPDDNVPEFLKTIQMPDNLKLLKENLPKPNYNALKFKSQEKDQFLKMLDQNFHKAKQLRSLANIGLGKDSSQGKRLGQPKDPRTHHPYGLPHQETSLANINRSLQGASGANIGPLKASLPHLGRKHVSSLESKLKYLNRKKLEQQYQKEMLLQESQKPTISAQEALSQRYESILGSVRQ